MRAAAERRLPRAREPDLPRRDPRRRAAGRPRRSSGRATTAPSPSRVASVVTARAPARDRRPGRRAAHLDRRLGRDPRRRARAVAEAPGEIRGQGGPTATPTITFTPALPAPICRPRPPTARPAARHLRVRRWDQPASVPTTRSGAGADRRPRRARRDGVITVPAAGDEGAARERHRRFVFDAPAGAARLPDRRLLDLRRAHRRHLDRGADRAPPLGVHHHYARLAMLAIDSHELTDCRVQWPPPRGADGHDCGCTACVTAESHNEGRLTIQQAVDRARETGGTICSGPGDYKLGDPVRVTKARSLSIRGRVG